MERGGDGITWKTGGDSAIVVTGASGFIGRHLVARLSSEGRAVIGLHARPLAERLGRPFQAEGLFSPPRYLQVDLRDQSAVDAVFERYRVGAVVHAAAYGVSSGRNDLLEAIAMNTAATASLGERALRAGVGCFLYLGSAFEYAPRALPLDEVVPLEAPNFYGATKAAGWSLLSYLHRLEGLPLVTVRAFSTYGPGEDSAKFVPYVITRALKGEPMDLSPGRQIRDYTYVEDLIDGLVLALDNTRSVGQVYNLGIGVQGSLSVRAMVERIVDRLGASRDLCRFGELRRSRRDPPYLVADPTKAHLLLGWAPTTNLDEGLDRTIAYYRSTASELD